MLCSSCPRNCKVDRQKSVGFCSCPKEIIVAKYMLHHWEEPIISGDENSAGSGAIFFGGCNLKCVYCQNEEISFNPKGIKMTPNELASLFKKIEEMGALNINLVSPTQYTNEIIKAIKIYRPKIPIIYNTSGYELPSLITELLPYVDIFLTDMKYSSDDVSKKYSRCSDYVGFCKESTDIMIKNKPLVFDGDLMKQGVIVRHLVLPGELKNTFGVIDYFTRYKGKAYLSVMSQFTPEYRSSIKRGLTPLEYKIVLRKIIESGIDECFVQELSSASEEYIPEFNTGNET